MTGRIGGQLTRLRHLAERHPRGTALTILGLVVALFAWPLLIYGPVDLTAATGVIPLENLISFLPMQFVYAAGLVLIVLLLGWQGHVRLTGRPDRRGLRIASFLIALCATFVGLIAVSALNRPDAAGAANTLVLILLLNLMVGVFEEGLFRGVLLYGLARRHGMLAAFLGSSMIFGVFHLTNLAVGQSLALTLFQVVMATSLGLLLGAVAIRANSLWPAIVLHALWNSYVMAGQLAFGDDDLLAAELAAPRFGPTAFILPGVIALLAALIFRDWRRHGAPGATAKA